ncbi:MAG: VTT domain-containing protein [Paracoccus sp. (in: a-proteobacteria)]|uniref:DedA family protein n=1 Tax=Paracoccus sp. TaxID=267 RepID=UPI0026E05E0C|nr:VTT domain-containing protein [Paracoccus sp. (in: a-proteobacteria)]MDO5613737.1 VTT domain-containing protein [Paracoccus sp. (in: a-proteobacteria)]
MTETLLGLVPQYGVWLLAACAFLSCLALPAPSSILLLAAGGFVAAGDLAALQCAIGTLAGAFLGDQLAYQIGRRGGGLLRGGNTRRAAALSKAQAMLDRRGGLAVFLSRWLVSALGPWVTFAAGMAGLGWARFTAASLAGMLIWVAMYLALGYSFAGNLEAASGMALHLLGFAAAAALVGVLGWRLLRLLRTEGG